MWDVCETGDGRIEEGGEDRNGSLKKVIAVVRMNDGRGSGSSDDVKSWGMGSCVDDDGGG